MDNQMQFDFMSDGPVNSPQKIEPKTGNEIPPGSSAEEVSDEVDAKLSVGEYVIPADVVQYFGVQYFEKLREKAKKALGDMDQTGRVNGGAPQDDLPFDDEELATEDDGSEVPQGMAAGGIVAGMAQGAASSQNTTKTYVGPGGAEIQIQFVNGQPVTQIPPGFILKGGQVSNEYTPDEGERPQNTMMPESKPMTEWELDDFSNFADQKRVMQGFSALGTILGPGGALVGRGAMEGYRHSARKAMEEVDRRLGESGLDEANKARLTELRGQLEQSAQGGIFSRMGDSMREGNGLLGGLLPEGGLMGRMFNRAPAPTTPTTTTAPTTTSGGSSSAGLASRSTAPTSRAPTSSPAPPSRPSAPQSTPRSNPDRDQGFDRGVGMGTGPMAEGGLIKKRK